MVDETANNPGMTAEEKSKGIGCLVVLAIVGAIWAYASIFGDDPGSGPSGQPAFVGMPMPITTGGHFSAVIAEDAQLDALTSAARATCEGRSWCQVLAWENEADRASAMPMLSRESETVAFSYLINRATDTEKVLRDCARWPGPPEACL